MTVKIGNSILDFSSPRVMSVLNVTPDSFYKDSRVTPDNIVEKALQDIADGASIIDVGGCSTKPGASFVSAEEEYKRVYIAFKNLKSVIGDFPISLDTFRSEIVERIYDSFGPFLVNDISCGTFDDKMFMTVARLNLPYVLCYIGGNSFATMHECSNCEDIVNETLHFFSKKLLMLDSLGVRDIILDPNFGFGKNVGQNIEILKNFSKFTAFNLPCMAGISRKRFVCSLTGCTADQSLPATSVLHMVLLHNGANLLRVHDTKEAIQTIKLFSQL